MKAKGSTIKILVLLLFILVATGCGRRNMIILYDGLPLAERSYKLTSPANGLTIEVVAARWHYIDETGEKVLWPEYFGVEEKFYIDPDDTEFVAIDIRIRNPNKVYYRLDSRTVIKGTVSPESNGSAFSVINLYEGRLRYKATHVKHIIDDETVYVNYITVKGESDFTIMKIGRFTFIGRKADTGQKNDTLEGGDK